MISFNARRRVAMIVSAMFATVAITFAAPAPVAVAADCNFWCKLRGDDSNTDGERERPKRCGFFFCADQSDPDRTVFDQPTKTCGGWFQPRCGNGSGTKDTGPTCGGLFQPRCGEEPRRDPFPGGGQGRDCPQNPMPGSRCDR